MKTKTIYAFGAALLLSAGIAIAQTPTPATQPAPGTNINTVNPSFGSQINSNSIPDPLRSTLQGTQYKGWENGTMYFNQSTNQYSLQMAAPVGSTPGVNPLTSTTPTTPMTPTTPSPTTPASPIAPNPMVGLQTTPVTPGSPVAQPVTIYPIYRFDQNGRLIPQN